MLNYNYGGNLQERTLLGIKENESYQIQPRLVRPSPLPPPLPTPPHAHKSWSLWLLSVDNMTIMH